MAIVNLGTLLQLLTPDQIYDLMLAYLASPPAPFVQLPVANWRTGGPYQTILKIDAQILGKAFQVLQAFVRGGYLKLSSGGWLDLIADSFFDVQRMIAVFTQGNMVLTAAAGAGPYTIQPGGLVVKTASGLVYRSINGAPLNLPQGGTVTVPVQADIAGAKYNVSPNTITLIQSPTLLGMTVNNPATNWITQSGADQETDQRLIVRCINKWGILNPLAFPQAAYIHLALSASPEIAQVGVHANLHGGVMAAQWITLVLAGYGAQVSDAAVTAVQNAFAPFVGTGYNLEVDKATLLSIPVTGTVYIPGYLNTAANQGMVLQALSSLAQSSPLGPGRVFLAAIEGVIEDVGTVWDSEGNILVPGPVQNVQLTAPTGDTALTYIQQPILVPNLTFQGV